VLGNKKAVSGASLETTQRGNAEGFEGHPAPLPCPLRSPIGYTNIDSMPTFALSLSLSLSLSPSLSVSLSEWEDWRRITGNAHSGKPSRDEIYWVREGGGSKRWEERKRKWKKEDRRREWER
jgi:hypothetical protein